MHQSRPLLGLILLGTLLATALGCREEVPPLFRRNRPPDTTLTIVPEDSSDAFYRYHVYWRGEDPDGEVVRYLFAITDTLAAEEEDRWDPTLAADIERGVYTTKTDSVFLFNSQAGRQAFNIVAIDDFGEKDPSPARAFFNVTNNGAPRIVYLEVVADTEDPRILPCVAAESCTVSTFTDFSVRFTATTGNGAITGYTWQTNPPNWEPFGGAADTNFVELATIDGDTIVYDFEGRPKWELSEAQDEITVYLRSARDEPVIGDRFSGNFLMKARTRDEAKLQSFISAGQRLVTVNYDPDTRLFAVPECDCPNPPPNCDGSRLVNVGWITGISEIDSFATIDDWVMFCEGDTIPNASYVRFYARGWDDDRDLPIDPQASTLPEVSFRFRFEYSIAGFSSRNMSFSSPAQQATDLLLPSAVGGGTFRGASTDWLTCPFNYDFFAGAVDEHGRVDGTPAGVSFSVGGTPQIDSLRVPSVLVFVPTCPGPLAANFCPGYADLTFGPDTLAVLGTSIPDDLPWETPFGLGWNTFVIPFRAFGHDHPRDQNPPGGPIYYKATDEGHIRSWKYSFDCTAPACEDQQLPGEDVWKANVIPAGQGPVDVFDDVLSVVRIPLDTLCVDNTGGAPCPGTSSRARLVFTKFGRYRFEIQGKDTEFIGQTCNQPSGLGANAAQFSVSISDLGRTTQLVTKNVHWVQLRDVRTLRKATPVRKSESRPFANRKRLMR